MALSAPNPPADTNDPISNAVVRPEASLFVRQILKTAIDSSSGNRPDWAPKAKALLANVLMNDLLNGWNPNFPVDMSQVQGWLNDLLKPPLPSAADPVVALASHAQGLVYRSQRDPRNQQLAFDAFKQAVNYDDGFARAHAQLGNQMVLLGQEKQSHGHFKDARDRNPHHPASGYFDWAEGRACFQEMLSAAKPDFSQAIKLLKSSVKALPTVWYNRCYLAAAQNAAKDPAGADSTMRAFINDPQFKQILGNIVPSLQPNSNDPPTVAAARDTVLTFVHPKYL